MLIESTTPASTMELETFDPHPGDIIILQRPIVYADGTLGPLVQIYKDNFYFRTGDNMMSRPSLHTFKRGEKILRLFKLFQNWEFFPIKRYNLYLYYPGIEYYPGYENDQPWHLVKGILTKDTKFSATTHFIHLPPSKLFHKLTNNVFSPRLQDIIIHTLPIPDKKVSTQKCTNCKKLEQDALYWSLDVNDPISLPSERDFELELNPTDEACDHCRLPRPSGRKHSTSMPKTMPWANQWELEFWSETFQPQLGDLLVRWDIDTQYGSQFKKTHLQVELFAYMAEEKIWKYLGMDVADFGPLVQMHDIVYRLQPGDIIISKSQDWSMRWDKYRHSGGSVLFYKDMHYFGGTRDGPALWEPDSERNRANIQEVPSDSWVVRIGSFDEYWEFHFNDRANVFAMHPNGKTMLLHYSADFPHMSQPPIYKYGLEDNDPKLISEEEVEPNHWDLVVRPFERVHEDPLKRRAWKPDPHHWMRDPTLWGRDNPPRFDKEVEIHPYQSAFVFEDKDLLLRAGFEKLYDNQGPNLNDYSSQEDESETNNYSPIHRAFPTNTNASVEIYQVRVDKENVPTFMFLGRDQYSFPDEFVPDPIIDYSEDVSTPSESPRSEIWKKNDKGGEIKDGGDKEKNKTKKRKGEPKEGKGNGKPEAESIIVKA